MPKWRRLTSPARLGLPLTEEAVELMELMEEALGLFLRRDLRRELLTLVGVVHGKPIRVTLWTGAKRPYRGIHWKYLNGWAGNSLCHVNAEFGFCYHGDQGRHSGVVTMKGLPNLDFSND